MVRSLSPPILLGAHIGRPKFDKNGNTGGCQDVYTVTPSLSSQDPTCANVTLPPQLEVEGIVNNGPISQYGWIEQVELELLFLHP
jgi:hypothetical protein